MMPFQPAMLRRLSAALMGLAAGAAWAGGCSISTGGLAFGMYQPLTFPGKLASSERTSDATVSLVCTGITAGGSYTIALGPSSVGNSTNPRWLANPQGGPHMAFNVYREATFSTVWGDGGTGGLIGGTIPVGNSNQSHTVHGRAPAGQSNLRPGPYSATMVMTVSYNP